MRIKVGNEEVEVRIKVGNEEVGGEDEGWQ